MDNTAVITVNDTPDKGLTIFGSTVCKDKEGRITINSPEDATYKAYINGKFVGSGIGVEGAKSMDIYISEKYLEIGQNIVNITASNENCTVNMDNIAIITVELCKERDENQKSSSIDFINLESMFSINPNPADEILIISLNSRESINGKASLFDLTGKEVIRINDFSILPGKYEINVSNLPAGIYFFRADTEFGSVVKKVIIE